MVEQRKCASCLTSREEETIIKNKNDVRIERLFDNIERKFPLLTRFVEWVRQERARFYRIPLSILLILGGIFSFMPILGIWMLPLGLLLLAIDIRPLRGPMCWLVIRGTRWIQLRIRAFKNRKPGLNAAG